MSRPFRLALFLGSASSASMLAFLASSALHANPPAAATSVPDTPEVDHAPPCAPVADSEAEVARLDAHSARLELQARVIRGRLQAETGVELQPPSPLGSLEPARIEADFDALESDTVALVGLDCSTYPCVGALVATLGDDPNAAMEDLREAVEERWPGAVVEEAIMFDSGGGIPDFQMAIAFTDAVPDLESLERRRVEWMMEAFKRDREDATQLARAALHD